MYVMGIDAGSQALKGGIFDLDGNLVYLSHQPYQHQTLYPHDRWAVQKPVDWLSALKYAVQDCVENIKPDSIVSLAVAATAPTILLVNESGNPLSDAIFWSDRRSVEQAETIQHKASDEILKHCGQEFLPEWTLPKILWLKENHPNYDSAYKVCEQADWLVHKLTGMFTTSRLTLIRKANYLAHIEGWPGSFLDDIGLGDLEKKLPNICRPGVIAGNALPGFGLCEDTVVAVGGLDCYIGFAAMGVYMPGQLGIVMGTSIPFTFASDKPFFSTNLLGPYYDLVIPNLYFLSGSSPAGGSLAKWVLDNSQYSDYAALEKLASDVPVGSNNLFCLPYFDGVKTPVKDPEAKGAFIGLDFSHKTEHMFRSVYEAIAFSTKHSLDELTAVGCDIVDVFIGGGGTKSALLTQILADVLGKDLNVTFDETSLLGSAMFAAVAAGKYDSIVDAVRHMRQPQGLVEFNPENHRLYSQLFETYKRIYPALKNV